MKAKAHWTARTTVWEPNGFSAVFAVFLVSVKRLWFCEAGSQQETKNQSTSMKEMRPAEKCDDDFEKQLHCKVRGWKGLDPVWEFSFVGLCCVVILGSGLRTVP